MKTILLNPGPVTLSDGVRQALMGPDTCHREVEFADLTKTVIHKLLGVYALESSYTARVLTGSGSSAVEAMLATLVAPGDRPLVLCNGVYGERMANMLARQGKQAEVVRGDWLAPIELQALETRLESDPTITQIITVHNETTTGRLNDIGKIAAIAKPRGLPLLLDAVSSFGGEEIDFIGWGIAACAATANKCLHGVPGISFVVAQESLLAAAEGNAPGLYLDLTAYRGQVGDGYSPFTQSVQVLFALNQALDELAASGGWLQRRASYRARSESIRAQARALEIEPLIDPTESSSMITAFKLPTGLSYPILHDRMKQAGFIIYAGQGDLSKSMFRIANMGEIGPDDLARLNRAFAEAAT